MSDWVFIGHSFEAEIFEIEEINVWEHHWQETGEFAKLNDPLYTWQNYRFAVYSVTQGSKVIKFAAGEFSNTVWGFYQRQPTG